MEATHRPVKPPIATSPSPSPSRRLTPRDLVSVIIVLQARIAELRAVALPTDDLERQVRSARLRVKAGEYDIPPAGVR